MEDQETLSYNLPHWFNSSTFRAEVSAVFTSLQVEVGIGEQEGEPQFAPASLDIPLLTTARYRMRGSLVGDWTSLRTYLEEAFLCSINKADMFEAVRDIKPENCYHVLIKLIPFIKHINSGDLLENVLTTLLFEVELISLEPEASLS